jgi:serine/threonine protein kinase
MMEMILGVEGEVDGRADLYSFGATQFHLLTGKLPFPDPGHPIRRTFVDRLFAPERPSMGSHVKMIPESVDLFVQRLMSVNPADRPSTAEEAWEELQRAVEKSGAFIPTADSHVHHPSSLSSITASTLTIRSGPLSGTAIPVPPKGVTLGRTALNPNDQSISRFHIRVKPAKRGFVMRDLGSLNGLIYQGKRVRRVLLPPGESVLVGETEIRFNE